MTRLSQFSKRRRFIVQVPLVVVMAALFSAGCRERSPNFTDRIQLEPVRGTWGLTGRSKISCPAGDCILFHFARTERLLTQDAADEFSEYSLPNMLKTALNREDSDAENDGMVVPPSERWGGQEADKITLATFNCAAYAVGELLDLRDGDWIDTRRRNDTNGTIPFSIVLESYFSEVKRIPASDVNWDALSDSSELQPDDLICFERDYGRWQECMHVGRIRSRRGRNWIESEIGRGPIVLSTLAAVAKAYGPTFDSVVIYRQHCALSDGAPNGKFGCRLK